DLYKCETIRRMARHYEKVVEEVVRDADQRISEIELMDEAEKRQVIDEWNETEREYGRAQLTHEMIAEQADRNPEANAVACGEERVSYRELNERTKRVARYLRGLGVGPEVKVGVCLKRSIEMVVGLLGILKAGGVYVPLDPDYPRERLEFMLADSGVALLVSDRERFYELATMSAETLRLVCLEVERTVIEQE